MARVLLLYRVEPFYLRAILQRRDPKLISPLGRRRTRHPRQDEADEHTAHVLPIYLHLVAVVDAVVGVIGEVDTLAAVSKRSKPDV